MIKTIRQVGCCALAALACGCGDKNGGGAGDGKPAADVQEKIAEKVADEAQKAFENAADSAARLSAQTSAAAMKGRNLFVGIVQACTEREAAGLASVWPKSAEQRGDDAEDIAGMDFSTSTQFFNELFSMKEYGKAKWTPYMEGGDPLVVSFGEKKFDGMLSAADVDWLVLKGVADEMDDIVPVLVSANVNPADLVTSGSFDGKSDKPIRLGRANGAAKDLFGNEAFVVIRKSGAAQVVKAKYAQQVLLYNKQKFTVPAEAKLEYLKP